MQQEFDTSNVSPTQLLRSNDEPVLTASALDEEVQIEEMNGSTIVSNRYSGSGSNKSFGKSGKASSGKSSKASSKAGKARA